MKIHIQEKLILVTVSTILFICAIGAMLIFQQFTGLYKENVSRRIFAQAQGLKSTIEEIADLGLELGELRGLSQECSKLIESIEHGVYCFVMDPQGRIFYHSDRKQRQKFLDDPITQKAKQSKQNLVQVFTDDHGKIMYDFSLPLMVEEARMIGFLRVGVSSDVIHKEIARLKNVFLWVALLLAFMASLVVYVLSEKVILRPISKLVQGVCRVGQGDLSSPIDIRSEDEIGDLASAFNQMILNLKKITASRDELNQEILNRQKIEDALRAEKDRAQQYLDVAGVMILAIDKQGDVVLVNDQGCEILGYAKEEILGKNWFSHFLPNKVVPQVKEVLSRIMAGEVDLLKYFENPILTKKGQEKVILWNNCLLENSRGEIIGVLSSGEDVTDRRRSEKVMSLQRDLGIALSAVYDIKEAAEIFLDYALKIEGLDSGSVYIIEEQHQTFDLVAQRGFSVDLAKEHQSYPLDSLQGKAVLKGDPIYRSRGEIDPQEDFCFSDSDVCCLAMVPIRDRGKVLAVINLTSYIYREIPLRVRHWIEVFSSIFGGVVARVRAEESLIKNEEKYRELVQNANSIILRMDEQGQVIFFNEYAQKFFGFSEQEILGQSVLGTIVPFKEEGGRDLAKIIKGICETPEDYIFNENQNIRKDGKKIWIAWTNKAVTNDEGKREILCIGTDISKRKEAERQLEEMYLDLQRVNEELRDAQNQIFQSEKMAAVGQLSAGVAHEVKNPLAIILLSVNILLKKLSTFDDQSIEQLEMIRNAAERANRVVADLLSLSRNTEIRFEKTSLQEVVDDSIILAKSAFPQEKVLFNKEYPEAPIEILADKMLLEQVFFNLFSNAADAMVDQGTISIRIFTLGGTKAYPKKAVVEVADNGQGMAPDVVKRVFEPFFTTKEEGKGTGLGLSICYMILQRHNSQISIHSEEGKGTKISMTFSLNANRKET